MNVEPLDPNGLGAEGIHTVIVATPDLQGSLVGRRVPVERFPAACDDGIEICTCVWAWDIEQSPHMIEGDKLALCGLHNGLPDATLIPDTTTLRRAAWLDGVAFCFADAVTGLSREPLGISPRTILKRELARYRQLGLTPLTGTELEFYLFLNEPRELFENGYRNLKPTTIRPSDFMIGPGNAYEPFFQKLRSELRASRIDIETAQCEAGPGQWEMTFGYGEPLAMADQHALYKLAVRDASAFAGMTATFMARPIEGHPGSSCHIHLSLLNEVGTPVFWDAEAEGRMSGTMRSAVAGALHHSVEITAWYSPTVNSFRRNNSGHVAGSGRSWGFDNRTTTVRVLGRDERSLRFEFRLPGADANPYLALAALLASVRNGIERQLKLPDPVNGNAYALGRDDAMPRTLGDAAEAFASSTLVNEMLSEEEVSHFKVLFEHEWEMFLNSVSDWDLYRYFERI